MGTQLTWASELINWIMYCALIDMIKWTGARRRRRRGGKGRGNSAEGCCAWMLHCVYVLGPCQYVHACARVNPQQSVAGAVNQGAQSAYHQRSAAPPQRGKIYTQRCQSLFLTQTQTRTHTRRHSVFTLTVQSRVLSSEECLSQSVPSRCVSTDNCCVKYYNKQNSKMVLACQQLPYFNHVCRLLAEMENFPPETKGTLLFLCNPTKQLQSEPQSLRNKGRLLSEDLTDMSNLPH